MLLEDIKKLIHSRKQFSDLAPGGCTLERALKSRQMSTARGQKEESSWVRGESAESMFVAFKKLKAIKPRETGRGK